MAQISVIVTVVLAAVGYFVTYVNGVRLENRKSRLKYLSDQIQFLYGPLFSLSHASQEAWRSFRSRYRPEGAFFDPVNPLSAWELEAWRMWMVEVFMPLNLRMEKAIIENAHLIEGSEMPHPFIELLSHVEVYRVVLKKWERNDFTEHTAYIEYPLTLDDYVAQTYRKLTRLQTELLNKVA